MTENIKLVARQSGSSDNINRENEESGVYFRSDRYYKINGSYYFSTREGLEVGPYESKENAESGLDRFIQTILAGQNMTKAKTNALSGAWAITNFQ